MIALVNAVPCLQDRTLAGPATAASRSRLRKKAGTTLEMQKDP